MKNTCEDCKIEYCELCQCLEMKKLLQVYIKNHVINYNTSEKYIYEALAEIEEYLSSVNDKVGYDTAGYDHFYAVKETAHLGNFGFRGKPAGKIIGRYIHLIRNFKSSRNSNNKLLNNISNHCLFEENMLCAVTVISDGNYRTKDIFEAFGSRISPALIALSMSNSKI